MFYSLRLIMIVPLVTLQTTLSFAAGEPQAICPNPTINAVEGENVYLPCYLDPPSSVVGYALDWKRRDLNKVVYSYRHKQGNLQTQMDQYRGRATLNHEDLRRGILTLRLSSVQLSDSGPYRCFVSKLITSCNTTLNITKEKDRQNGAKGDDSSTAGPPVDGTEPGNPGAAKTDTVRNIVIAGLGGVVLVCCGVIFIVVKFGKKTPKAESFEMESLRTRAEVDEDSEQSLGQLLV